MLLLILGDLPFGFKQGGIFTIKFNMFCKICGDAIVSKEDIHWLDDILVCSECYEHETGEEND